MRAFILAVVVSVVTYAAYSQEQLVKQPLTISRMADKVYMLRNETEQFIGGNVAVLAGNEGLVLVDTQGGLQPRLIFDALKNISSKPIRYVIDTHCHADHIGGNAAFQKTGATLIAHENVRRRVEAKKCDSGTTFASPSMTFDRELTMRIDDEEVRIIKLVTGHTDGDSIIYFKEENVVATGDVFVSNGLPFHSRYAGGTMLGTIDQLKQLVDLIPEDAKIIPGHGPQATVADIKRVIKTMEEIKQAVAEQISRGKKLNDLIEMKLLSPWKEQMDSDEAMAIYLRNFYDALQFSL